MHISIEEYQILVDDAIIGQYSNGECWKLAYALNYVSGWPIVAVAEANDIGIGWVHILNQRPDGMYIDILGEHDMMDVWEDWGDLLDDPEAETKLLLTIHRADFQRMLFQDPKEVGPEVYKIAEEVYTIFKKE